MCLKGPCTCFTFDVGDVKFLVFFEAVSHFNFTLGPANYIAVPDWISLVHKPLLFPLTLQGRSHIHPRSPLVPTASLSTSVPIVVS